MYSDSGGYVNVVVAVVTVGKVVLRLIAGFQHVFGATGLLSVEKGIRLEHLGRV